MVKYIAAAVALKCFSCGALMRRAYRSLGNQFGGRQRQTGSMPAYYPDRLKRMLRLNRQFGLVQDGDQFSNWAPAGFIGKLSLSVCFSMFIACFTMFGTIDNWEV